MRAIRVRAFGEPDVLRIEELPDPVAGAGQVVVRVRAAGVNPVETYIRSGKYASKPNLPYTPGNDAAGEVESIGAGVTNVKAGDRVYVAGSISGTYAEKTLAEAQRVHPLPSNVSFSQGAALGVPYGTAYRALFHRADTRPSDIVLVHGATGGVGIAAVQLAVAHGCRVIGTGGSEAGRKLVSDQGAALVLDHHARDYVDHIMRFTAGNGVDVILEMLANVNLGKDLPMLAKRGRVAVIGSRGRVEIDPRDTMGREADIHGVFLGGATPEQYAQMHADIRAGLARGTLKPIIQKELPLDQAPEAHVAVMQEKSHGKIVLIP